MTIETVRQTQKTQEVSSIMLDRSYYQKTDEIISRYVREQRSLIPIMQDIQAEYRYLPAELLSYVAKEIGITEAVLRRLVDGHDTATLNKIAECGVRGDAGIKEFTIPYNGIDVSICVASGLANARKVLESVKSGEKSYHFIEVMACPGGCVMGGGQPISGTKVQRAETRTKGLYAADGDMVIKKSNENPLVDVFYNGYFKGKAHELLHNHHD